MKRKFEGPDWEKDKIILEYFYRYSGSTYSDGWNGVGDGTIHGKDNSIRTTMPNKAEYLRRLNNLKRRGLIIQGLPEKNKFPLYFNENHSLQKIPFLMREFQEAFSDLTKAAKKIVDKNVGKHVYNVTGTDYTDMHYLEVPLNLYAEVARLDYVYSSLIFPFRIRNATDRQQVLFSCNTILADIQRDVRRIFSSSEKERLDNWLQTAIMGTSPEFLHCLPANLFEYLLDAEQQGLDEETKPVLDVIWKLTIQMLDYLSRWTRIREDLEVLLSKRGKDYESGLEKWLDLVDPQTKCDKEARSELLRHEFLPRSKYGKYFDFKMAEWQSLNQPAKGNIWNTR